MIGFMAAGPFTSYILIINSSHKVCFVSVPSFLQTTAVFIVTFKESHQAHAQEEDKIHWQMMMIRWKDSKNKQHQWAANNNNKNKDNGAPSIPIGTLFFCCFPQVSPSDFLMIEDCRCTKGKGEIKQCQQRLIACIEMSAQVISKRTHDKKWLIQKAGCWWEKKAFTLHWQ